MENLVTTLENTGDSRSTTNEVSGCEVCGAQGLPSVLDLGRHPMCDDLVPVGDSRRCQEYPIDILFCAQCVTAHQHYQVPKLELFPKSYHYRSRFTADVLAGMRSLVAACADRLGGLKDKKVLDIGCNDGSLLDYFREAGATTFGIEPTGAALDASEKGHVVYDDYFTQDLAKTFLAEHGAPDFMTFTNVFAHIEDLRGLVESLKILKSPKTVIVIENHYLGAVLSGNQFDTFYHEHPRTYSFTSFVQIAESLGLKVLDVEFPSRYGGNIRVMIGNPAEHSQFVAKNTPGEIEALLKREQGFGNDLAAMSRKVETWKKAKQIELAQLVERNGPLKAKAFPGRAAILVKLLGLDEKILSAVYEKPGSLKVGNYLPGTRIPIRSDDELFTKTDVHAPIVNLAWHIPTEIRKYLSENGYAGKVIDILKAADFS